MPNGRGELAVIQLSSIFRGESEIRYMNGPHFKGPIMKTDLRNSRLARFEVTDFVAIAAMIAVVIFAIGH